jgi:hypothetical protein
MGSARSYFLPASLLLLLAGWGVSSGGGGSRSRTRPVVLLPGASVYQTTDTIQVTIANQSPQTVFFADHQTNCTVIQLQRRVANSWEAVAPCQRLVATHLHTLPAGQAMDITLTAPGQWSPGLYRAKLDYQVEAERGTGVQKAVVSREFHIG